jgi:hypothetical protein
VGRNLRRAAVLMSLLGSMLVAASASADSPPVFVIGDGNATVGSHVTFWGAQWAKDNSLSGGDAPSAFKGLALTTGKNCQFTTGPGNSVDGPDALPPGDVLVLVASLITKSGSSISGTFTGMAMVQPDPGYAGDPGHAGTGMVVALRRRRLGRQRVEA